MYDDVKIELKKVKKTLTRLDLVRQKAKIRTLQRIKMIQDEEKIKELEKQALAPQPKSDKKG